MDHPSTSVPVMVGLDDNDAAVRVCVLDARGGQRLNRDPPNDAGRIVAAVARHGRARPLSLIVAPGVVHCVHCVHHTLLAALNDTDYPPPSTAGQWWASLRSAHPTC